MAGLPRTIIVTGASSGIGRALALAAGHAGYRAVIVARRTALLDETARAVRGAGGTCIAIPGDVTDRAMPARIVTTAMDAFGRIDVIVNNAGAGARGALLAQSDAAIEAQWQQHVAAPLRLARAALDRLEATRGQLVFVGSGVARVPLPNFGAYNLAKAAIRAAAIQLRRELRPRGIAVTYVDPGVVASEFHTTAAITPTLRIQTSCERAGQVILRGIARRRAVVNVAPWQTVFTALGEYAGTLADPIIRRFAVRETQEPEPAPRDAEPAQGPSLGRGSVEGRHGESAAFELALEPVARRMERVKLPQEFLRGALVPGATLELGTLAMRWAGMPNKNERAALRETLDALAAAGYLEPAGEETWRVTRAAD